MTDDAHLDLSIPPIWHVTEINVCKLAKVAYTRDIESRLRPGEYRSRSSRPKSLSAALQTRS